jgi:hypothetical protein
MEAAWKLHGSHASIAVALQGGFKICDDTSNIVPAEQASL